MPDTTPMDIIPNKKKHNVKPTDVAISKTLVFPTPATPTRHLFRTSVTLHVGPNAHSFPLHLEALLACSPFFTASFNPTYGFREALTSSLSLPTHNVQDFEYLVQWVYTRTLTHESLDGPHPAYFRLVRLWKVADALHVPALKNSIIDELSSRADATNSVPTPDDTRAIFGPDVGEHMTKLRDLVLDLFMWKKTDALIETHPDSWDEGFLRLLFGRLKRKDGEGEAPWREEGRRCERYHKHDGWAPSCGGLGREGRAFAFCVGSGV
ncbi:hypothetical protein MMC21_001019 [Puttea exsequens]|nr:hypothetical protein [Puttea exsequens]